MFVCSICNKFGGNSFSAVLRHMGEIHRHDPSLHIRCGVDRCPQTYTNYESFRSHVYRKHRDVLYLNPAAPEFDTNVVPEEDLSDISLLHNDELEQTDEYDQSLHGAKFLLKTREQHKMPQSTLDKIKWLMM